MSSVFNLKHKKLFLSKTETLLCYGGAGAGKSYSVADKICIRVAIDNVQDRKPLKVVVIRKSMTSMEKTCIPLIEDRMKLHNIPYSLNRGRYIAKAGIGAEILYISVMNGIELEKVKSLTDVHMVWIEEANELIQDCYDQGMLRMRGGDDSRWRQMILTFNPISVTNWIYQKFFENVVDNVEKIRYTVDDNDYINKSYVNRLDRYETEHPLYYKVYRLGEWGTLEEAIYGRKLSYINDYEKVAAEETLYGLDFGYSNPTALVEIKKKDNVYYLKQLLYKTKMTNDDLIEELKKLQITGIIYADSAEPARIEAIARAGFNIIPAEKSVQAGIMFCQDQQMCIDNNSDVLKKQMQGYCKKKDRNGKTLEEPVKVDDHFPDAVRYGIYTPFVLYGNGESEAVATIIEENEAW